MRGEKTFAAAITAILALKLVDSFTTWVAVKNQLGIEGHEFLRGLPVGVASAIAFGVTAAWAVLAWHVYHKGSKKVATMCACIMLAVFIFVVAANLSILAGIWR